MELIWIFYFIQKKKTYCQDGIPRKSPLFYIYFRLLENVQKVKKIKNFYKTALSLSHADVIDLIDELKYVQHILKEIDTLISKLSKDDIYTVKFLGD